MKVVSIIRGSVAPPRTGFGKSATLRPDLEGETHLPLQASPIRKSNQRSPIKRTFMGSVQNDERLIPGCHCRLGQSRVPRDDPFPTELLAIGVRRMGIPTPKEEALLSDSHTFLDPFPYRRIISKVSNAFPMVAERFMGPGVLILVTFDAFT